MSTSNSGEDIATTHASSEVDERQIWENVGFTAAQKREASAAPSINYHSNKENSVSISSHIPSNAGKPVALYSTR